MAQGKYEEWLEKDNLILLEAWARSGFTDEEIAKRIGIAVNTLYSWRKKYKKIDNALKKGKEYCDLHVESALYRKALGYDYEEVTRELKKNSETGEMEMVETKRVKKHVPPDRTAQIFWLKNRNPRNWKDRQCSDYEEELLISKNVLENEKLVVEIEKKKAEVNKIKGVAEEIEDLTEIEEAIYGKES
ncbi:helix-turn-helix domain-containing protein [Miniphocaeibacter massiliensis]|uniref:helix-turn-helix domain-containing protein n=1 Tax=Miniphocaeibacter massiliensis TaxID=2041841 RepID=UPI00101AD69F|nr:helix-turn-helix domain-containing protein [Miniphocaeibacter massiliensis]